MRFFFVEQLPARADDRFEPPRELSRHLSALRLSEAETFLLLGPGGPGRKAQRLANGSLRLLDESPRPPAPPFRIALATAWPKSSRAERLVAGATEAGVLSIQPLLCDRSVAGTAPFRENRVARWARVARETGQQCGSAHLPELRSTPCSPAQCASLIAPPYRAVLLDPGAPPLLAVLDRIRPDALLLFVGPEGGFSPEEKDALIAAGAASAGLGPALLRIESAAPLAAALAAHWHYSQPNSRNEL